MMRILILGLLIILVSCNTVDIEVENNSGSKVDSVIVTNGFDSWKHKSLEIGEVIKGELVFSEKVKTDGGYQVKVFKNKIFKSYGYGYYSNGLPGTEKMIIEIQKDTISVKEIF